MRVPLALSSADSAPVLNKKNNNNMTNTILLVEDDKKISMALSLRLQSMGYVVDSAADAVYAMKAAVRCQPEVILLDINLPGGSGFVVADRLRASSSALSSTPIIFITASKDPAMREKASSYHGCRYLEKPFQAAQLVEAIDSLAH